MANLSVREGATAVVHSYTVSAASFAASAHGGLTCRQCHADITGYPHASPAGASRVSCDQDCHATDGAGRPYSHASVAQQFAGSVHGRSPNPDDPTCLTCHGGGDPHAVAPVTDLLTPAQKVAQCAGCHADRSKMAAHDVPVDAVASYERSFHYKAIRFGAARTAACPDCHTAHDVLAASDPRSSVAAGHVTETCGHADCHAGAKRNFAVSGANHLDLRVEQEPVLFVEERFFLLLTVGTLVMLVVGIALDVQRKFGWLARLWPVMTTRARALADHLRRIRPRLTRSARRTVRLARHTLFD